MKIKNYLLFMLIFVMVFALAACGGNTKAPATEDTGNGDYANLDPIVLKYANGAALGAAGDLWGVEFNKAVEDITGGKITVDYFPNSQLGVDSETQTQMLGGDIDIVSCQPAQTTSFVPQVGVFDLPLVFAKYDAATIDKALNDSEFTVAINKAYGEAGMISLGFLQGATFREMTSNVKIETIDDFNGVRIRTMDSKYHLAFWEALGANPTPLAFTELYMSLQQGVVDAQENANDTNASSNFFEVQKYLVNTHHILYMNQFLINKSKFDSLDPLYQDAIKEAVAVATSVIAPQMAEINSKNKQILIDKGMESLEFEPAFYDEMIAKSQSVYTLIRTELGDDIVDALINSLEASK